MSVNKSYDVVVVGGGMSGVCAAIAAARHGARTVLVHNRPVLGGNASSEIRMHISGARDRGHKINARETGILEEIQLENRLRNPQHSFSIFDTVIWEKVHFQENLELLLNTHMTAARASEGRIQEITAVQLTTEKTYLISGRVFIDTTGDGSLANLAGAAWMSGRDSQATFNEPDAPEVSDTVTMGSTLLFSAYDAGYPVPFVKPTWAYTYNETDLSDRDHSEITSGYWWIEMGGGVLDIIDDGEDIRDNLLKSVYGVWDHIKNGGNHQAENYVLDWIGFLPGKRESRRIVGDYVLQEQDLLANRVFPDAVAYGGWAMDLHVEGGLNNRSEPTRFIDFDGFYTIPLRCLCSRDIENLMVGGRAISATHLAFSSTRVMGTCAVVGQAAGTAAAMAVAKSVNPLDLLTNIRELQQTLIRDDCFIPGYGNEDPADLARQARVSCSSEQPNGCCTNITNGLTRQIADQTNCWLSEAISQEGEWIELSFSQPVYPQEVMLRFDANLSKDIRLSLSKRVMDRQVPGIPPELVKTFRLELYHGQTLINSYTVNDNHQRNQSIVISDQAACDRIRVYVLATHGDCSARIFEIRIY